MPVMDGYAAIERIMAVRPTPIVVLSSRANRNQMQTAFEAMRRGALEVLPKPEDTASWQQLAESLPETVRAVAEAQRPARGPGARRGRRRRRPPPLDAGHAAGPLRWVAIGASTGGPAAIRELLRGDPGRRAGRLPHRAAHRRRLRAGLRRLAQQGVPARRAAGPRRRAAPRRARCGWRPAAPTCCWSPAACCASTPTRPAAARPPAVGRTSCSSPAPRRCPRRGGRRAADRHGRGRRRGARSRCARRAASPWRRTRRARSSSACRGSPWRRGRPTWPCRRATWRARWSALWERRSERVKPAAGPGGRRQRGDAGHPRPHPARRRLRGAGGARRRRGRGARPARAAVGGGHRPRDADHGRLPAAAAAQGRPAERRTSRC